MPEVEEHNPHSTARVAGHPLHPMLVPFPIAFFVSTLVTDLLSVVFARPGFAVASMWLLGAGIAAALLAAVLGFTDFMGDRRIRALREAWFHMIGNLVAVVLEAVNLGLRVAGGGGMATVGAGEVVLSALVVVLLLFTGWMGWEMVYRRHVGVSDAAEPAPIRVH
jgi:uncharacterized membrane protein